MTPAARLRYYRERIERIDPKLHSFLYLRLDKAEEEAAASTRRHESGEAISPIDGWSVAVKANIGVEGMPHHAGIAAYERNIAAADAEVVRRLRAAGAVIIGVVNMDEGALGATTDNPAFGRTQNPWRDGFTPGGSSGGSAAAVAAGLCDTALGSDTMGSVRIPSAYCGVQGHKPTAGAVPDEGVLPLSDSLDHVGVHARRVSGLASMMSVMSGRSCTLGEVPLGGLVVGVWYPEKDVAMTEDIRSGFSAAIDAVEGAGAKTHQVSPPGYAYGRSRRAGLLIAEIEAAALHADRRRTHGQGFSPAFSSFMEWGEAQPAEKKAAARAHLEDIAAAAPELFAKAEIVLAPVAPQAAFPFAAGAPADQADLTAYANIAGLPATAVFAGIGGQGLPLSIQVIGASGADEKVLSVARSLEALFGAPPLPPL